MRENKDIPQPSKNDVTTTFFRDSFSSVSLKPNGYYDALYEFVSLETGRDVFPSLSPYTPDIYRHKSYLLTTITHATIATIKPAI